MRKHADEDVFSRVLTTAHCTSAYRRGCSRKRKLLRLCLSALAILIAEGAWATGARQARAAESAIGWSQNGFRANHSNFNSTETALTRANVADLTWQWAGRVGTSVAAPEIVESIVEGRQPTTLNAEALTRRIELPLSWCSQRTALNVE